MRPKTRTEKMRNLEMPLSLHERIEKYINEQRKHCIKRGIVEEIINNFLAERGY